MARQILPGQRARRAGLRQLVVAVALVTAAVGSIALSYHLGQPRPPGAGEDLPVAWPGWGFTHTQFSADEGNAQAVANIEASLEAQPMVQVQHIMGWGAGNPEPAPGRYDFASLDRRMDLIRRTSGIPVITLCCAPDWMKGGEPGQTDWEGLTTAPLPEYFDDFAALSAKVAERYPFVRHFIVWNEFKGFFDDKRNRWRAEDYTDLYNAVYDALKAVHPDNQVGGPYLDFASSEPDSPYSSPRLQGDWGAADQRVLDAFNYWMLYRHGADFVVVDGHATTRDGAADEFAALDKFAAVGAWLRERVDAPIWWAEWYVEPTEADWSPEHDVALRAAAMIELASSGAQTVIYWNPEPSGQACATCLWTDTWAADGGQPLPFLTDVLQPFVRSFPPGVARRQVHNVPEGIRALASEHALVVVNTTDETIDASIDGQQITLSAYETRWVSAPP